MTRWIGMGLALLLPTAAHASECEERAARMAAENGVSLERRTPGGEWVHFTHPSASNLSMRCRTRPDAKRSVHLRWDGASPPARFFALAGRAAEIAFEASPGDVRLLAFRCYQQALAEADHQSLLRHK